jgi:hypothetical protein
VSVTTFVLNTVITASDNNLKLFGSHIVGSETIRIQNGISGILIDANFERVELFESLEKYEFVVIAGVGLQINNRLDHSTIVTIPNINQSVTLSFADGSATLVQTGAINFSLGGKSIEINSAQKVTISAMLPYFNSSDTSSLYVEKLKADLLIAEIISNNAKNAVANYIASQMVVVTPEFIMTSDAGPYNISWTKDLITNTLKPVYLNGTAPVATSEWNQINLTIKPTSTIKTETNLSLIISGMDYGLWKAATPNDFVFNSTIVFTVGESAAKIVNVNVLDDFLLEGIEYYKISLLNNKGSEVASTKGIINDASRIKVSETGNFLLTEFNTIFDFDAENLTYTISGFASGNSLNFHSDTQPTIMNNNISDGKVDVQWAINDKIVNVSLVGLTHAQDIGIYSVDSFRLLFGDNSLVTRLLPVNMKIISPSATVNATPWADTFIITTGNLDYLPTINGFAPNDKLSFGFGATVRIVNTDITDSKINVIAELSSHRTTIELTGISSTIDSQVFDAISFKSVFGEWAFG